MLTVWAWQSLPQCSLGPTRTETSTTQKGHAVERLSGPHHFIS